MRLSVCRVSTVFLLCVEYVQDLYIVLFKCESDEVFGIGLDQIFGDRVVFGHVECPGSDE